MSRHLGLLCLPRGRGQPWRQALLLPGSGLNHRLSKARACLWPQPPRLWPLAPSAWPWVPAILTVGRLPSAVTPPVADPPRPRPALNLGFLSTDTCSVDTSLRASLVHRPGVREMALLPRSRTPLWCGNDSRAGLLRGRQGLHGEHALGLNESSPGFLVHLKLATTSRRN